MNDLQPYLRRIAAWRKTVHLELWPVIDQQWSPMLVPLARENLQAWGENAKYRRAAAREIIAIDAGVEEKTKIADVNIALWMFCEEHRTRFVDPICLVHALGKLTRRLCPSATRRKFDLNTGTNQSWVKYSSARTLHQLGSWLIDAYGAAGVRLARAQFQERQDARHQKARLKELLGEIPITDDPFTPQHSEPEARTY